MNENSEVVKLVVREVPHLVESGEAVQEFMHERNLLPCIQNFAVKKYLERDPVPADGAVVPL